MKLKFSITFINLRKGLGPKFSLCYVVHIFTVQVVILFNRQLIKLWKGAQTPWEKLEKVLFFSLSLSKCIVKGRKACYKETKQQEENMFLRFH